jgi:hypothetical protein
MQSVTEQNFNNVQYIYIRGGGPTHQSQRKLKGDFTCMPRGSPLSSDGSCVGQVGKLDHREVVAEGTQN